MKDHKTPIDPSNAKHCPYAKQFIYTPEQAIVVQNTNIIETEGNWAFGRGYRRCAGEVLTLEMMKEWIRILKALISSTRGIKPLTPWILLHQV